jgi:outer membrane protein insertion porin family
MRLDTKYSFSHRVIEVDDTDLPNVSPAIRQARGSDNISLVQADFTIDDLDNPLKPTSGYRVEATETVAGVGGDVHYFKTEVEGYYFMPLLFDGFVLKAKGTAGHVEGWPGFEEVPIIDRFYKGSDSFRGFQRAGIGPRMSNGMTGSAQEIDSIGGKTYAIGTLEVTFPLGLPEEFGIEGAVFTDFGTVFNAPESTLPPSDPICPGPNSCQVFDKASLRASVGAGLIWQSPFGPLRVDVAWPFLKEDFDKTELVRFSAGTRF